MTPILVADDDPDMRALVREALVARGHEVIEVPDGGRLLVLIARCCRAELAMPRLIISDLRMPVMTGLGMLKAVRDARWTVPVILMTAFPHLEVFMQAEALDARVLPKPFSVNDLVRMTEERLAERAG